ncbi:hypothetical protein D3C71_1517970 [compost metagenome]
MPVQRAKVQVKRGFGFGIIIDLALGHGQRTAGQKIGADRSGVDHRGMDAELRHFRGQRFGQPGQRELACRVAAPARVSPLIADDGRDIDDVPMTLRPKRCKRVAQHGHRREKIHLEVLADFFIGQCFDGALLRIAGVVDDHIDAAERPHGLRDRLFYASIVGQIHF